MASLLAGQLRLHLGNSLESMNRKPEIVALSVCLALITLLATVICFALPKLEREKEEHRRYEKNFYALTDEVERYKTKDSLNAISVSALELRLKEYETLRAEDAKLISSLRVKNSELNSVTTMQSEAIAKLSSVPRDTIILRDSIPVEAKAFDYHSTWYDLHGVLTPDSFGCDLAMRDSLLIAETIHYRRFLGFLWKTKNVDTYEIDVVSKNPDVTISDIEFIRIDN